MINSIIQIIIENKEFLEKSLEESVNASEISMFSKDLRKVFDEAGRKTLVGILESIDTVLFESKKTNTKLKKYDKIIARNIKKDVVNLTEMRIPVMYNGERTGTREILKKILYA